jgi:hypothetical protein
VTAPPAACTTGTVPPQSALSCEPPPRGLGGDSNRRPHRRRGFVPSGYGAVGMELATGTEPFEERLIVSTINVRATARLALRSIAGLQPPVLTLLLVDDAIQEFVSNQRSLAMVPAPAAVIPSTGTTP